MRGVVFGCDAELCAVLLTENVPPTLCTFRCCSNDVTADGYKCYLNRATEYKCYFLAHLSTVLCCIKFHFVTTKPFPCVRSWPVKRSVIGPVGSRQG
jgi:hypothetical protein